MFIKLTLIIGPSYWELFLDHASVSCQQKSCCRWKWARFEQPRGWIRTLLDRKSSEWVDSCFTVNIWLAPQLSRWVARVTTISADIYQLWHRRPERGRGEERRKLGRVLPSSLGFSSSELWQGVTQPVPGPALSAVAKLSVTLYSLTSSSSYDRLILILAKISSQIQKTQTMHFSPHLRSFNDLNFAWSNAATINKWD